MRLRALVVPACAAALLLTACTESVPAPSDSTAHAARGDIDALIRSGAVGALTTLTDHGATTVLASGLADIAARTPMTIDRPEHVRVGSITKSFTAAIVLQLVAEHRIGLDRPVDAYLPGLLVDGRAITVRQLLGHRSGLTEPPASAELNEYDAARDGRSYTPTQAVALALRNQPESAPGSGFHYANTNYLIAGMLIEAVTGHPYGDELRERILLPLGLSDTYLPPAGDTGLRDPHPTGYGTVDGAVIDQTRIEPSLPWASGALVSTGADLNHFYTALLAGRVVPPALLRQMLDGVDMGNGDGMSYGLGIGYTELPCGTQFVGHVGGVPGFSAISGAATAGRAVTVSYTGTPAAVDIRDVLTHALCG